MDIDFARSLPLAIKFSLEPCLPITNAVARGLHNKLNTITCWLLEKPSVCTILVTIILAFLIVVMTFILTIIFGTLCIVVALLLLEGLLIAYSLTMMCGILSIILFMFTITSLFGLETKIKLRHL